MLDGIFKKLKWQLILWLARRLPDCKRMTRSLGESLDRRPTWRERLVMKLHLFTCEACARYLEQIEFLKEAVHTHGTGPANDGEAARVSMSRDSKERIKAVLRGNMGLAF
jgi:hypothetical protein